ncbi:hypothetical protein JHK85_023741 [Glycine max]|nr:hypothetical protein JHK85_023741 [Glycine max]
MARRKSIASRKLTKRQMVLAEKDHNKGKASNSHPMKQHTRHLGQTTSEIPPCASSHAISRPTDPFARTSDVIPPPSIQGIHSPHTSQPTNPDAGHTIDILPKMSSAIGRKFVRQQMALAEKYRNKGNDSKGHPMKQCTTRPVPMTSQIPPCASSHAISRPTDPFARTSDVRDPPSIQGVHSPCTSQPTNLDAGHTLRSFVALETQNNDGKPIIYLSGQGFLPSRPVANEIGDILKSHYTDPWSSWKKIPIITRDLWLGEFLSKETGTLPTPLDLFRLKHQLSDNTWVDIQEEFARTLEQLTKSAFAQGNPPPSESDVWHAIVRKKGLGMVGRPCYHGSSSSMEWVKRQDFDELRKKMKEIRNERDRLQSRVANIERLAEHNNALIRELMESMNKPSTIDESQDEDGSN